jgi:hypothetical protein
MYDKMLLLEIGINHKGGSWSDPGSINFVFRYTSGMAKNMQLFFCFQCIRFVIGCSHQFCQGCLNTGFTRLFWGIAKEICHSSERGSGL